MAIYSILKFVREGKNTKAAHKVIVGNMNNENISNVFYS